MKKATARSFQDTNPVFRGILKRILIGPDIAVFIGGFLAILTWHIVFSQKRANLFMYIFSRFLRTIPIIICLLILDRLWPRLLGAGPFYRQLNNQLARNCERSWWKLFLFISNQDRAVDIVSWV